MNTVLIWIWIVSAVAAGALWFVEKRVNAERNYSAVIYFVLALAATLVATHTLTFWLGRVL